MENCVLYACVRVVGDARVRHRRGAGIPRRKSVEICRAERISDSLLGQTDGCRGKKGRGGEREKKNSMAVQRMTSERRRANERGGREWVGGWFGGVLWEKHSEGSKARSPSPQRAAVNTLPLGGGSQSKALYLIYQSSDSLSLPSPCTGLQ